MPTTDTTAAVKRLLPVWSAAALWILISAIITAPAPIHAAASDSVQVQALTNLQRDASLARQQRIPILIAFFASWCEWCERVEQEFLRPMLLSGEYRDKVIIRKLEIDSYGHFAGLDGRALRPEQLADRYNADLTPTLVFIDHRGNELAERMIGLTTPSMYGGYLDEAIDQARARYRAQPTED